MCDDMWRRVVDLAEVSGRSYSWVVRYAVFRLIRRKSRQGHLGYVGNPAFRECLGNVLTPHPLNRGVWGRRAGSAAKHRHRLCLYGEDELYIRLAAAQLGCSMTHLVRLAIEKYAMGTSLRVVNTPFFYWLGIKTVRVVELPTISFEKIHFEFKPYSRSSYY